MYTYANLTEDINYLNYNGVKTGSIGKSVLGNKIYYIHVGSSSGNQIIVTGGIHARENVTSLLAVKQAYRHINSPVGIYFVPMVNPDGALLIQNGANAAGEYASFVKKINNSDDFSLWKANVRAVDLNNNFDAKFGLGKGNVTYPAPHGYVGEYPFSEPESDALKNFTLQVKPVYTVSYHALGQEVYWYFGQSSDKDKIMAKKISDYLGYKCVSGDLGSTGGYKDWCVLCGIPGVTVEIGSDKLTHPVSEKDVAEDIDKNLDLPSKIHSLYNLIYSNE